ncbi:MAG TPA: hypothetical protein VK582_04295 [Pyrinomonadaceae bacterium]|nr:hypothetical protein [Pyrinomonadaceae bacterium]
MAPDIKMSYPHIPDSLFSVLKTEFNQATEVYDLFDEFFQWGSYDRAYALTLLERARGGNDCSWTIRRLATLMLEHQLLNLSLDSTLEFDFVFVKLGIKSAEGASSQVDSRLSKEGYSTIELRDFIVEFRRKLERHTRVHSRVRGAETSARALRDFIHLSRRECKLSLARYLWTPEEVTELILRRTRLSRGMKDGRRMLHPYTESETERTLSLLPDFEADILRRLRRRTEIFWVMDSTSSELNSLVEYPLTTVVLVIKPPGSDWEFEIKRAGAREEHPLNVIYAREGEPVPVTHRLHAGSMGEYLRWEASASAFCARLYRLIHGREAPISNAVSVKTIYSIPGRDRDEHILRYFTDRKVFGNGFERMRAAMEESITAFQLEKDWRPPKADGELGLTAQFLSFVAPGQALLVGTTSFRLDRLARYLSPDGVREYFTDGLRVEHDDADAQRFLDEILDEVMGVYVPPAVAYSGPKEYVYEAFRVPENRQRANINYLSTMREIGNFWGTLLALKGFSRGESFVARNVGLKSVWENGQWIVKIIFMDHDDLDIAGKNAREFYPRAVFPAIEDDELLIFGGIYCGERIVGAVEYLRQIFRVREETAAAGTSTIHQAMADAYKLTQRALIENAELRAYFHESFLERVCDCDKIVAKYLAARLDRSALEAWKANTTEFLSGKGYPAWMINDYLCAVDSFDSFLVKYSFLY